MGRVTYDACGSTSGLSAEKFLKGLLVGSDNLTTHSHYTIKPLSLSLTQGTKPADQGKGEDRLDKDLITSFHDFLVYIEGPECV